jgi:hypothetical protein
MTGIPDCEQYQSVATYEPLAQTWIKYNVTMRFDPMLLSGFMPLFSLF